MKFSYISCPFPKRKYSLSCLYADRFFNQAQCLLHPRRKPDQAFNMLKSALLNCIRSIWTKIYFVNKTIYTLWLPGKNLFNNLPFYLAQVHWHLHLTIRRLHILKTG